MKKMNFFLAALFVSAAVMVSSCSKDTTETDPGPSLTLKGGADYTSADVTIQLGTTIKVGVIGGKSSVSGNKLTKFKFIFTSNNIPTTLLDSTINTDSFNWETELEFTSVGTGILSFELTDKGNMVTTKSFSVTIEDPGTLINKYPNVVFGSWNDAVGSFFSSTEGINYTVGQTSASASNQLKIDFLFFKGAINGNTIASPDDADANTIVDLQLSGWTNKNQTRFNPTTITPAQFDAIGDTYQFPTFNLTQQSTKMNQLVNGQVFLFKTKNDKLGLVKVVDLYSRGDRAKLSVIVQK